MGWWIVVPDMVGNVTRQRYEQIVTEARELVAQITKAQFALGDKALEIEPLRPRGGAHPGEGEELFTVEESLAMFAEDIGVAPSTVKDWRWTASRWPAVKRRDGVPFSIHRILCSVQDDDGRWASIDDPPFHKRTGQRRWTQDGPNASWVSGWTIRSPSRRRSRP